MSGVIGRLQNVEKIFLVLCGTQMVQFVFSMFFTSVSSRMINPEQFGHWSQMLFIFNIYAIFTDLGLEVAVFENDAASDSESARNFASIFWMRVCLSIIPLLAGGFLCICFGKRSIFFFLYSLFFCFDKISNLLKIWFDKNFQQDSSAKLELTAFISSNVFATSACYFGALTLLLPAQKIFEKLSLLFLFCKKEISHVLVIDLNIRYLFRLIKKFAIPSFSGTMAGLFIYDFLPFILSVNLGNYEAGLFARAFSLACLPMLATTVFNRITTPLYSKFSLDKEQCKMIFLKSQMVKATMMIPLIFFLQQSAASWLPMLWGAKWAAAIPLYRILSFYALVRVHYDDLGALVNIGLSRPKMMAKNQVLHALLILACLPMIIYSKSIIVACVVSALCMLVVCVNLWLLIFYELKVIPKDIVDTASFLKNRGLGFVYKKQNSSTR